MTIALASVPSSIDITPDVLITDTLIVAGLAFPAGKTTTLDLSSAGSGYKSDVYQALYAAQQKGLIDCVPAIDVLSDPSPSGHTLNGGQDFVGTIGVES